MTCPSPQEDLNRLNNKFQIKNTYILRRQKSFIIKINPPNNKRNEKVQGRRVSSYKKGKENDQREENEAENVAFSITVSSSWIQDEDCPHFVGNPYNDLRIKLSHLL